MNQRTEITHYINSCTKCFGAFKGNADYPEVFVINYKTVYKDLLILGVKQKYIEQFKGKLGKTVAITMWEKMRGYQIKGSQLLGDYQQYEQILENEHHSVNPNIDFSKIKVFVYKIDEFYHVTPGKLAGQEAKIF